MKFEAEKPEIACFNCTRPAYYCDHVECTDAPEELMEGQYDDMQLPRKCGLYHPVKIDKCHYCEAPINEYAYKHKHWFEVGECAYPICLDCYEHATEEMLAEFIHCVC